MPHNVRPDRFTEYQLHPSQCCEWLIESATTALSSTIVVFGWMSDRPALRDDYHAQVVLDQIEKCRQLLSILEAHVGLAPVADRLEAVAAPRTAPGSCFDCGTGPCNMNCSAEAV